MPTDIIAALLSLIQTNWNPANTASITPEFGVGQAQEGGPYRVLIDNTTNEDAVGTSGIAGIASGGETVQILRGLVFINCSCPFQEGVQDPDKMTNLFAREIQRIVNKYAVDISGYDYISFLGYNRIPPQQGDLPKTVKRSCRIGFQWRYTGE